MPTDCMSYNVDSTRFFCLKRIEISSVFAYAEGRILRWVGNSK